MESVKPILEFKKTCVSYTKQTMAVKYVSAAIERNTITAIMGPSGCGKTTTLRVIAGFVRPDEGDVLFDGEIINALPPHKRQVNTIFQRYALFPHLNIFDNIAFGLKLKKVKVTYANDKGETFEKVEKLTKKEIREKVEKVLKIVDLEGFEKRLRPVETEHIFCKR